MTDYMNLAQRLRDESGVGTHDVKDRVKLMDEAADAIIKLQEERDEAMQQWGLVKAERDEARKNLAYEIEQKLKLAAVIEALIENSQRVEGGPIPWVEIDAHQWDAYLSGNPADILRERDAEKWDEGYTAYIDSVWGDGGSGITPNPYRTEAPDDES